jgi:hypothetical protein
MTPRALSFFLLLASSFAAAAQSAEKTFSKSFNTEGKTQLTLELPGDVDMKVWKNDYIRIEITASLASGNASLLHELANVGRYNLTAKVNGEALVVSAPNLQKQVRVKGEALKETMTYVVFVPENVQVKLTTMEMAMAAVVKPKE